jgi:flagellar M-ring protein FliF
MQERLKEIPKKFLEYWNKWTSKQKTIIISVLVAVIILIAVIVAILGRTKYVALDTFDDTKTASQVVSLLKESTIDTKLAADNQTVMVDEDRYGEAIMAVAISDLVQEDVVSLTDLLTNSLTTTNGERLQKDFLYQTGKLEKMIR